MAPLHSVVHLLLRRAKFDPGLPSSEFSAQWTHPGDVFSVLLILGGDVVSRALAQVAGTGLTPVTFSFGWVAYAVTAVVSAVGENKLMPLPDCACQVINGKSSYVRENKSWVLGRIVRDYEAWMDPVVQTSVETMLDRKLVEIRADAEARQPGSGLRIPRPTQAGLCVSFYRAEPAEPGKRHVDLVYGSGFVVVILQLGAAAIPCGLWGDWSILLVTVAGILLAFISGALPQWRKEKWACRMDLKPKTVVLTRGNGSQHAIVIRDPDAVGIDLESLAAGQANVNVSASMLTRLMVIALAILWILLLITASGIKTNTWFLLAVGGIGIVQNIFVAGNPRHPKALGVPIVFEKVIVETKVMKALYAVEEAYPKLGFSMRETFFPGGQLNEDEKKKWEEYELIAKKPKP